MVAYVYFTIFLLKGSVLAALLLSGLTLASLFQASMVHPGPIPIEWQQAQAGVPTTAPSWCKFCEVHKPYRTHHCRHCRECVMRYDHHCDWIDNCVGAKNHKLFVLFLVYIDLAIFHYFKMLVIFFTSGGGASLLDVAGTTPQAHMVLHFVALVFYTFLVLPCALFGYVFLFTTVRMLVSNETTWESQYSPGRNSRGVYLNLVEVFGPNPIMWLIPTLPSHPLLPVELLLASPTAPAHQIV